MKIKSTKVAVFHRLTALRIVWRSPLQEVNMNHQRVMPTLTRSTLLAIIYSSFSFAQSTPSEFAGMSLADLFEQSIDDPTDSNRNQSPWSFSFERKTAEFRDYLDGNDRVSQDDILWNGPSEPRTNKNFPVVPNNIVQTAYLVSLGYAINDSWRAHVSVPYIEQETDHISIVPNYSTFIIDSTGVGDMVVSASHKLSDSALADWWLTVGLSLPTGSIDEEGDTPRAPGDQQLPYTMQLGSGTYDFPIQLSYHAKGEHDINVMLAATIRSGTNDRDYRLGNNFSLTGRYQFNFSELIKPYISLGVQWADSIHGADTSLLVNSAYPYPAAITNPDLFGGIKVDARVGMSWEFINHYRLSVELGKPIYQNLNGPQTQEDWRSSLRISRPF
jgi:hypothetical protein